VTFRLEFTDDPRVFLRRASAYLEADPVLTTVVASVTAKAAEEDAAGGRRKLRDHPRWWLTVVDEASDEVVGTVMRTAPFRPHPLYVLPMPDVAARQVAARLVQRGETISGVNGALPAAEELALELARRTGRNARVHEHTRLHVLDALAEPPQPAGRPRAAVPADAALVLSWFRAFHEDAAAQSGRRALPGEGEQFDLAEIEGRIDAGRVWLWEDLRGARVSMVGFAGPTYDVARVGPVYTPQRFRGHGYASALTAHVSRLLRDAGAQVCLFTDQANPTSNKIYAAIGYVPVVDMANLVITRPVPPPPKIGRS
jgi:GNAT superfamily N-acetyltransferase